MAESFSRDKSISQIYFNLASNTYPGVYLSWDRLTSNDFGLNISPVIGENTTQRMYVVLRSTMINGNYIEIGRVQVPTSEFIDESGIPGYYYIIQLVQLDLNTNIQTIIANSSPIKGDELLIFSSLAYEVSRFLDIPVRDEEILFNSDRTQGYVSHNNIVYSPKPEVRISGNSSSGTAESYPIIDDALGIPYSNLVIEDPTSNYVVTTPTGTFPITTLFYQIQQNGRIFFQGLYNGSLYPVSIPIYDTVLVTYRVRLFSNTEMNDALFQALQYINARPGSPKYNDLSSTPYYYEPAIITIATYYLLRRLLMRLTTREVRLLIGDLGDTSGNNYSAGMDLVKTMMDEYNKDMDKLAQNAAWAYYPNTQSVTTDTYQLPGSRSAMFRSMFFKDAGGYG